MSDDADKIEERAARAAERTNGSDGSPTIFLCFPKRGSPLPQKVVLEPYLNLWTALGWVEVSREDRHVTIEWREGGSPQVPKRPRR